MRAFVYPEFNSEDFLLVREPGDLGGDGRIILNAGLIDGRDPTLVLQPAIDLNVLVNALHDVELIVILCCAAGQKSFREYSSGMRNAWGVFIVR